MKKTLVMATAFMLSILILLAGCSSKGAVGDAGKPLGDKTEGYFLPIVKEPFTVSFATVDNPDAAHSYTQYLPAWQELEKRTGIKVKFEVAPSDQYNTIMQTRLAAGTNLPDVIRLPDDPIRYAKNGLIIPMDVLIQKYAVHIQKLFADRPEVKKLLTAPDGKVYVLAAVVDARSMVNLNGIGMRKDWLKKLNLQEPDTIREWFAVLQAFKEKDPNQNGKQDEIPVIAMNINALYKFAWSYGLHLSQSDGWYADKNGNVAYEWIDSRVGKWLEEMNSWYKAGLIDPDITSAQSYDKYTAKAIGNIAGVGASDMTMQYPQWNEMMAKTFPDAGWEGIIPPKGPDGDRIIEKEQPTEGFYYGITKDCKKPDIAIKWLDYLYASEEGKILLGNFGLEGKSYALENGKPVFTDFILKNEKGSGLAQNSLGVNGNFPRILMKEMIEQRFYRYGEEMKQSEKTTKFYVPAFPKIMASNEEIDSYAGIMTDINTYRDEMITKFITGQVDISKFDEYVKQVKGMGIEEAIAIRQTQYDRYLKN
jgi:putative aldouronate transport system substrate-binding protein